MKHPCDDRGVPCKLAQLSVKQMGWRALGLKSVTRDPVVKQEQSFTAGRESVVALIGGVIGWIFWQMLLSPMLIPKIGMLLDFILLVSFAISVGMLCWFVFLNRVRRSQFTNIAQAFLTQKQCAACGYSLVDLEIEDDCCVLCPECNAAWKHARVGAEATEPITDIIE